MEDLKHTPGPWKAIKAPHGPIDIFDQRMRDVATVYGGGVENGSQKSNANLIAAAPDLLRELKILVQDWDGEEEDIIDAREAIAKAEGRS